MSMSLSNRAKSSRKEKFYVISVEGVEFWTDFA